MVSMSPKVTGLAYMPTSDYEEILKQDHLKWDSLTSLHTESLKYANSGDIVE